MRCHLKTVFTAVLLMLVSLGAAAAVNIQSCTVTPTTGGLLGCPTGNAVFVPVGPTTLVRSAVNGAQGWRAFNTLQPADQVYTGAWVTLSTISVAQSSAPPPVPPPPVVPPPVVPPPTQSVVITSTDNPQLVVTFTGIPTPGCFTINAKQVCVP